jgi:hypothetical protein
LMRNKEAAREDMATLLPHFETLGNTIITKIGPAQRADALSRGAAAVFGNDPDFKTYQDARMALAGQLAVAQQGSRPSNEDVRTNWLPMVPDPYSDTAESARMKWDLMKKILSLPATAAPPDPNAALPADPSATPAPAQGGSGFRVLGARPVR